MATCRSILSFIYVYYWIPIILTSNASHIMMRIGEMKKNKWFRFGIDVPSVYFFCVGKMISSLENVASSKSVSASDTNSDSFECSFLRPPLLDAKCIRSLLLIEYIIISPIFLFVDSVVKFPSIFEWLTSNQWLFHLCILLVLLSPLASKIIWKDSFDGFKANYASFYTASPVKIISVTHFLLPLNY